MKVKQVYVDLQNRLWSFWAIGEYAVEYLPNQWVSAPIGGLLYYSNPSKWLLRKLADIPYTQLWQCETKGEIQLPRYAAFKESYIRFVWHDNYPTSFVRPWPKYTAAAQQLKLVRRITP